MNPLIILIECYKPTQWNMEKLSTNLGIPLSYISATADTKEWFWNHLHKRQDLTLDFIEKHRDKPWNWIMLRTRYGDLRIKAIKKGKNYREMPSSNDDDEMELKIVTLEELKEFDKEMILFNFQEWHKISCSKNISWDDIASTPQFPWDLYAISERIEIPWNFIRTSMSFKLKKSKKEKAAKPLAFNWEALSNRDDLTWSFVKKYSRWPWHWSAFYGRFFGIDFILKHPYHGWRWQELSKIASFSDVFQHPQLPWQWTYIIKNTENMHLHAGRITLKKILEVIPFEKLSEFEQTNIQKLIATSRFITEEMLMEPSYIMSQIIFDADIMKNPVITWEIAQKIGNVLNIRHFKKNKNMTMKICLDNPEEFSLDMCDAKYIPKTLQDILSNPQIKWNWKYLSRNTFDHTGRAARKIVKNWLLYKKRKFGGMLKNEIALMPPIKSKGFPGGEEYRKSCEDFHSKVEAF